MCNLYDIGPAPARQARGWRGKIIEVLKTAPKTYAIRKTDPGIVLRSDPETGETEPEIMRWGFHRDFNPALNNARFDKLKHGMWSAAWQDGRRCVIPVATFYEWSGPAGSKQTHAFLRTEGTDEPDWLWMAGLWEDDPEHGRRYTMITTDARGQIAAIHDRMPVILVTDDVEGFLSAPPSADPEILIDSGKLITELATFRCLNPMKSPKPGSPVQDQWLF